MKLNPYKGFFLAIEGLDGSGSDKVAFQVAKLLTKEDYQVVLTKEPTNGQIGRFIKKLIKKRKKVSPLVLEYLFAADRAIYLENKVLPSLQKGKIVVSDRSLWSSVAYRSPYFHTHWLLEINAEFILPDNTYFVDLSPFNCSKNIKKNAGEVAIFESEAKLSQIREGYEWISQKFPYCFDVIDAEQYTDIAEEIVKRARNHHRFPKQSKKSLRV